MRLGCSSILPRLQQKKPPTTAAPTLAEPQALPCTTESNMMSVDNSLSGVLNLTLLRRSSWPNMTEAIEARHQTEELINQGMHLCFYHRVNCGQLMGAVGKCRALSIHVPPRKAEWGTTKVVCMSPAICRLEDSSLYLMAIPATRSGFFFALQTIPGNTNLSFQERRPPSCLPQVVF